MRYTFASERKLTFIISAGGVNRLVDFGFANENNVSTFATNDPKVAQAIRKNALSRRGIIKETTKEEPVAEAQGVKKQEPKADETTQKAEPVTAKEPASLQVREFDNYTVAREALCKEFSVNKNLVRNPTALAKVASEHGITIKYKEI